MSRTFVRLIARHMKHKQLIYCRPVDELFLRSHLQHVLEAICPHKIIISVNICMDICIMQCNDNPERTTLMTHFFKLTLNRSCRSASLEKYIFGKCTRDRVLTSVVEHVTMLAWIASVLNVI